MPNGSHLLNLPGELRNQIYKHVFHDITTLRINKNGFLVPPPIAGVCRQIYEEVQASGSLGHSLATRPSTEALEAQIVDWNFDHLVKFLPQAAQHGVAKVDEIKIEMRFTQPGIDEEAISRWIGCFSITRSLVSVPPVLLCNMKKRRKFSRCRMSCPTHARSCDFDLGFSCSVAGRLRAIVMDYGVSRGPGDSSYNMGAA